MDGLALVDTMGATSIHAMQFFVRTMKNRFPDIPLEAHFHMDFGLGVANTIMALSEGVEVIQSTVLDNPQTPAMIAWQYRISVYEPVVHWQFSQHDHFHKTPGNPLRTQDDSALASLEFVALYRQPYLRKSLGEAYQARPPSNAPSNRDNTDNTSLKFPGRS